jgi:hypothetical protein
VQDTVTDDEMNAQRILFTGTHAGHFRRLPPTGCKANRSPKSCRFRRPPKPQG